VRLGNAKKTVIVIDDDKSILRTLTRVLQKGGYEIDSAGTGKEAIEKLSGQSYNVALIDIKLPDMDGTDLLVMMQENLSNAVKILITGLSLVDSGAEIIEKGADACLLKPVKPEDLLSMIEEKLKGKKSRKNLSSAD
jgi:DNA-binding NtrC family response regulator